MTRDQFMVVRDIIEDAFGTKLDVHHHDALVSSCVVCTDLFIRPVNLPGKVNPGSIGFGGHWVRVDVKGSKFHIFNPEDSLGGDWGPSVLVDIAIPGYRDKLKNVLNALLRY